MAMNTSPLLLPALWFMLTAGLAQPQRASAQASQALANVKAHRDLEYVAGGHERHKLDLYLPANLSEGAAVPLIVWVHGGGWQNGSKEGCPPLRAGYVDRGYAVASINYRLSGHAPFPAQIEDCKAAIRWLRAHARTYGLDPGRFGVWGSSAGGHLVALLGTSAGAKEFEGNTHADQSSRVQAVCDYYGPTDFTVFVTTPGYERHADASSPESKLLGGVVLENKDKAARANPVTYVDPGDPPFLIVHGDKDATVPINQSQLLYESLSKAGVSAHFHTIRGAGHGGPGFGGPEIEAMVAKFFGERLKQGVTRKDALTTETKADETAAPRRTAGSNSRAMPWQAVAARSDGNQDGKVTKEEFNGPPALFARLDRTGDGSLTKDDFSESATPSTESRPKGAPPVGQAGDESPVIFRPEALRMEGQRWRYDDAGWVVEGILLKPEGKGPFPGVLISHGLGGKAGGFGLQKAGEMVRWGLVCIAPTYTHAAGSSGDRATYGASQENLRRASLCLQILRSLPQVDGSRLGAYGHSMGGFVTVGLAAAEPGVLKAAAITASGLGREPGRPAPTPQLAAKVRTPFLMLHGGDDTTVKPEQSLALKEVLDANKVPNDRLVAAHEGHPVDQTMREEVYRLVRAWFVQQGVLLP